MIGTCGKSGTMYHRELRQCWCVASHPRNVLEWEQGTRLRRDLAVG